MSNCVFVFHNLTTFSGCCCGTEVQQVNRFRRQGINITKSLSQSLTVCGVKLPCSLVVRQQVLLYLLSDGSRVNRLLRNGLQWFQPINQGWRKYNDFPLNWPFNLFTGQHKQKDSLQSSVINSHTVSQILKPHVTDHSSILFILRIKVDPCDCPSLKFYLIFYFYLVRLTWCPQVFINRLTVFSSK